MVDTQQYFTNKTSAVFRCHVRTQMQDFRLQCFLHLFAQWLSFLLHCLTNLLGINNSLRSIANALSPPCDKQLHALRIDVRERSAVFYNHRPTKIQHRFTVDEVTNYGLSWFLFWVGAWSWRRCRWWRQRQCSLGSRSLLSKFPRFRTCLALRRYWLCLCCLLLYLIVGLFEGSVIQFVNPFEVPVKVENFRSAGFLKCKQFSITIM